MSTPLRARGGDGAAGAQPPAAPRTIHDCGLSFGFLVELATKHLYLGGQARLVDLVRNTRLPAGILEPVLGFLRAERLCEVVQRVAAHVDVAYTLTELGRARAEDFLRHSPYAGPAPVSLAAYTERVAAQSAMGAPVDRARMQAAFAGCILADDLLDALGAAMNSPRTVFLFGPAGSGKTFCASRLGRVHADPVFLPHAIAVGNEVVEVYDPSVHHALADPGIAVRGVLDRAGQHDGRWIACQRPAVVCGGELSPSMLNLEFDEARRIHTLPAHVKANNGVLVIDDLGRQLVHVRDLLNRWILPLDSRVDYLALHSGRRFRVPVDVKVVFCTNLHPAQIGDEAFLRRLGHKIPVGPLSVAGYGAIFRQACAALDIPFSQRHLDHVLQKHRASGRPLLASGPLELLEPVRDAARYQGLAPELSFDAIDRAWNNRHAQDPEASPAAERLACLRE